MALTTQSVPVAQSQELGGGRVPGAEKAFHFDFQDTAGGAVEVQLEGTLTLFEASSLWAALRARFAAGTGDCVRLDLSKIEAVDGGAMALLVQTKWDLQTAGVRCELVGGNATVRSIVDLYEGDAGPTPRPPRGRFQWLSHIGEQTIIAVSELRVGLDFIGSMVLSFVGVLRKPHTGNWREVAPLMNRTGADAVPIVLLINFLIGFGMAFQAAVQLKQLGANIYVADLVGLSITRELGPLMTAIIVCGRSGAGFAAELGTMSVSGEIDALRTMGFGPLRFLVLPRMVALLLAMPVLTLLGDLVGVTGGMLAGVTNLDLTIVGYLHESARAVRAWDVFQGVIKGCVFGLGIGLVSCQQGLAASGGAEGVGRRTTSAVVTSVLTVIVIDVGFTMLFFELHL